MIELTLALVGDRALIGRDGLQLLHLDGSLNSRFRREVTKGRVQVLRQVRVGVGIECLATS